ncbi:MAG TPA: hypothetical protein DCY48_01370 [Candidatus Magasanikbacteria bacterium]|nr:MAG: hypothetical protein A3I74_03835 [Candidatus Magasanikbacteria bacterium RIFCSPLOWO2_02_FULL_47_16]OGH79298.1 MAG: hypothetical protein A3C10_04375 [Candidatus Magasanikbacteria bacterium RIFCSPHIGHO2_02_FULL_48_18]OGH82215.1 MAG: hypothetical protein A3G08_00950 [Candidatus Magasanikbacteria bacterium RIFCSPLOWO2_12_FULL_47_9b]HAZ28408.1 hypothetical protein [Candidatus Magasanikbacteria bacterium]
MNYPWSIIKKRSRLILIGGVIIGLLAGGVSFFFPRYYRADAQILILPNSQAGVDPYTIAKSAERIGSNVAEVLPSNDFFQKVMTQGDYGIDKSHFANVSERVKRKRWRETISSSVSFGTGILNVSLYGRSQSQAIALARASVDALVTRGWEYIGKDVVLKVVNDPVATRWPVRPNIPVNMALGFFVGLVGAALVVLKRERRE